MWDSRGVEDIRRQCIHHFAWTFVNEKAVFKVGVVFAYSIKNNNALMIQSIVCNCFNTTKRSFCICDNGWNMDPPLHSGVKLAVSWVDSSRWKLSKATKDANISRQGFGLYILGFAKYFVHRLSWERKNHQ